MLNGLSPLRFSSEPGELSNHAPEWPQLDHSHLILGALWTAFKINSVNVRPQVQGGLSKDLKTPFVLLFRTPQTWTIIIIDLWFLNVTLAGQEMTFKSRVLLCSTALFITALTMKLLLPLLPTTAHVVSHNFTLRGAEDPRIHLIFFLPCGAAVSCPIRVLQARQRCVLWYWQNHNKPHWMRGNDITLRHNSSWPDPLQIPRFPVYEYSKDPSGLTCILAGDERLSDVGAVFSFKE